MPRYFLLVALAGCIGIPGPAPGDPDAAPGPPTITCDRSFGELLPSPAFDPLATALDLVVADVDRDGLDDMIVLLAPDRVAVARTRGDGGYDAPVEVVLDTELRALATVDFDFDGDRDVVAAGAVVVVLRNDAGTLVEQSRQTASCMIDMLARGNFDDDLLPDVVAGCSDPGVLMLMRHDDAMTLGAPVEIGGFTSLRGVVAGDVVGDDRDDLVAFGNGAELLQAIGGGSFGRATLTSSESPAAAIGDLDADGRDDVIAWDGDTLAWYRGGTTPTTLSPLSIPGVSTPFSLDVRAIDGTNGDDLVVVEGDFSGSSPYRTLVITSPLTTAAIEPQPVSGVVRCRLGRLDAADELDLACMPGFGPLTVSVVHRDAVPTAVHAAGRAAVLAQFDQDEPLEVVTVGPSSVEVLEPAGDRFLVEASNPSVTFAGDLVAAVDWNHDQLLDLVMVAYPDGDGAIQLLLGTGGADFASPIELVNAAWTDLLVGDLDDDGFQDLAGWTQAPDGDPALHVAFGTPTGVTDAIQRSGLRTISITDVVGFANSAPELLVTDGFHVEIQLMDALDRTLTVIGTIPCESLPGAAVARDLDGDGDNDLVTLDPGQVTYARTYLHGVDNIFELTSSHAMSGWIEDLVVADVDGDGAADVIAGGMRLLRGQGDGRIAPPVPFARPARLVGSVRVPAGAAEQLIYLASPGYPFGTVEMLRPGCL
jgi:hypothetical protein